MLLDETDETKLFSAYVDEDAYIEFVHDGEILSKDAGGVWGLAHLPEQDHPLIQQVLALYRGERLGRPVGHAAWDDFAASMREAILL